MHCIVLHICTITIVACGKIQDMMFEKLASCACDVNLRRAAICHCPRTCRIGARCPLPQSRRCNGWTRRPANMLDEVDSGTV
jgi:hypothetical protein